MNAGKMIKMKNCNKMYVLSSDLFKSVTEQIMS